MVETTSSSSDSDENLYEPMRLMENKNPLVKLVAYGKIKRMMKEFQGRDIDPLERNMMRGMFRRKLKDFGEQQDENHDTILSRLNHERYVKEEEEDGKAKDLFRAKFLLKRNKLSSK